MHLNKCAFVMVTGFVLTHFSLETPERVIENSADPDHNAAPYQGLHCQQMV